MKATLTSHITPHLMLKIAILFFAGLIKSTRPVCTGKSWDAAGGRGGTFVLRNSCWRIRWHTMSRNVGSVCNRRSYDEFDVKNDIFEFDVKNDEFDAETYKFDVMWKMINLITW
eukprot:GHVP01019432.1.p2 GENE.GHVP01019432.1~~GHVP01019432.1.p2  ORF type:complete len:114 (-),score=5.40 GHVP01019432.1:230-571(-)